MPYEGSWLWRLRQSVGTDLVLVPGAVVVVEQADRRVLFIRRSDTEEWSFPGGAVEEDDTFVLAAMHELREEAGLEANENDLLAFASVSDPRWVRFAFPNGDEVHSFNLCFVLRRWAGEPEPDGAEAIDVGFFDAAHPPAPLSSLADRVLELHQSFTATGAFQNG